MKRFVSIALCIIITTLSLVFATGCKDEFYFIQDKSEIVSIEIISLKYSYKNGNIPEEIFVCQIEDKSNFLKDFSNVEFDNIHPPYDATVVNTPTAIKIKYINGDYEWIYPNGKSSQQNGEHYFNGTSSLDPKQFASLICKYVGEEPIELEYNFLDKETEISKIEIVKLGKSLNERSIPEEQNIIKEIQDINGFLNRFSLIDCFLNVKEPTKVQDNAIAIKISYNSGAYELITANGQSKALSDTYVFDGYRYFNESQFSDLIQSYTK